MSHSSITVTILLENTEKNKHKIHYPPISLTAKNVASKIIENNYLVIP